MYVIDQKVVVGPPPPPFCICIIMTFAFQIKSTPPDERRRREKAHQEKVNSELVILSLKAFNSIPKVSFDNVKLGKSLIRTLLVQNPSSKSSVRVTFGPLDKAIKSGFELDFVDFLLGPKEECEVKIGFVPKNGDNVREKVQVKYGTSQTHFILLGSCIAPR